MRIQIENELDDIVTNGEEVPIYDILERDSGGNPSKLIFRGYIHKDKLIYYHYERNTGGNFIMNIY